MKKDTATLARAAGDDVLRRDCQGSIVALNDRYRQLAEKAGLDPEFRRTYVAGFRDAKDMTFTLNSPGGYGEKGIPYSERGIELPESIQTMLHSLEKAGDCIEAPKGTYTMQDLSILTCETGVEYTTFTIGEKSFLLREQEKSTVIPNQYVSGLKKHHGTLDGHSHPFIGDITPSVSDCEMLNHLHWQEFSVIIDPRGVMARFKADGTWEYIDSGSTRDGSYYDDLWR